MNKDFERLTDDIIEFICEQGIAVVKFREEVEPEGLAGIDAYVGFGREHAKQLISLVAKGPLPGEVGRSKGTYLPGIGECETIALRPPGTGEEE